MPDRTMPVMNISTIVPRQWHLGRIDRRVMVQDGIFPWHDETVEIPADVVLEK